MTLKEFFATSRAPGKTAFAESIGMDKTYLSRLLSGKRIAGTRWIPLICRATNGRVRPEDLNPEIAHLFTAKGTMRVSQ